MCVKNDLSQLTLMKDASSPVNKGLCLAESNPQLSLFSKVIFKGIVGPRLISRHEWINPFTLESYSKSIVCYLDTFGNNLGIKRKFTKYLKESCCLTSG